MHRGRGDPLDELIDRGVARIQEIVRQGQADLARWARHQEELRDAHSRWEAKQAKWAEHHERAIRSHMEHVERHRQERLERKRRRKEAKLEQRRARRKRGFPIIFLLPFVFIVVASDSVGELGGLGLFLLALVAAVVAYHLTARNAAEAARDVEGERVDPERRAEPRRPEAATEKAAPSKPVPEETPEPLARVDALCAALLESFRDGPDALKEVLHRPERTLNAVKDACHALYHREEALRKIASPEEDERLRYERLELTRKLDGAPDAVVRERLGAAIQSLDRQMEGRKALATSAARLEAERTRLRYTLEALQTEVLRVKSADTGAAGVQGIEQELARVGEELTAVADSIDAVSRGIETLPSASYEPERTR